MMKFDLTPLHEVVEEMQAHIAANLEEIKAAAGGTFDVDWSTYLQASDTGNVVVLSLRHEDLLVGYSVFYISAALRDKLAVEATNHGVFLEKEYRQKFGLRMISEADKFLTRLGIKEIMYINDNEIFGRLLKVSGYQPKQTIWSKENGK